VERLERSEGSERSELSNAIMYDKFNPPHSSLRSSPQDVMSGLDDSIHSDTSMATESTESESSVSSSVCSRCSSPPIHIHSSKHNLKRSRSGEAERGPKDGRSEATTANRFCTIINNVHIRRFASLISGLQKSHYPPSRVSFNESVKVLPIPLRHEYSTRIRSLMYSNAQELYRNASRNTKEFMSEGWSVDGVVEENRMITWGGDLVHPVHFVGQG
jgi:hypothetical protein